MMPTFARAVQRGSPVSRGTAGEIPVAEWKKKGDIEVIAPSFLHADLDAELPAGAIQAAPNRCKDRRTVCAASGNDLPAIRRMIEGRGPWEVVCMSRPLHEPLCGKQLVQVNLLSNRTRAVIRRDDNQRIRAGGLHDLLEQLVHEGGRCKEELGDAACRPFGFQQVEVRVVKLIDEREIAHDKPGALVSHGSAHELCFLGHAELTDHQFLGNGNARVRTAPLIQPANHAKHICVEESVRYRKAPYRAPGNGVVERMEDKY